MNSVEIQDYTKQGISFYQAKKYDFALEKFQKANELDNKRVETYFHLSNTYVMLRKNEEAIQALKKVVRIDKDCGEAYFI